MNTITKNIRKIIPGGSRSSSSRSRSRPSPNSIPSPRINTPSDKSSEARKSRGLIVRFHKKKPVNQRNDDDLTEFERVNVKQRPARCKEHRRKKSALKWKEDESGTVGGQNTAQDEEEGNTTASAETTTNDEGTETAKSISPREADEKDEKEKQEKEKQEKQKQEKSPSETITKKKRKKRRSAYNDDEFNPSVECIDQFKPLQGSETTEEYEVKEEKRKDSRVKKVKKRKKSKAVNCVMVDDEVIILSKPACSVLRKINKRNLLANCGLTENENDLIRNYFNHKLKGEDCVKAVNLLKKAINLAITKIKFSGDLTNTQYVFLDNRTVAIDMMVDVMMYKKEEYLPTVWKST